MPPDCVPRGVFVLPVGHVRAALQYCSHRIRAPYLYGLRARWRPASMTGDVTTGTNCTRSRHRLDRGLHVKHNRPTITDGWPGHIPDCLAPEQLPLFSGRRR